MTDKPLEAGLPVPVPSGIPAWTGFCIGDYTDEETKQTGVTPLNYQVYKLCRAGYRRRHAIFWGSWCFRNVCETRWEWEGAVATSNFVKNQCRRRWWGRVDSIRALARRRIFKSVAVFAAILHTYRVSGIRFMRFTILPAICDAFDLNTQPIQLLCGIYSNCGEVLLVTVQKIQKGRY
jgi:hypothetical protein